MVATDDQRIADAVEAFGGIARMTRRTHRTGTDRIAEVAADLDCDIVVNVQGDEPLIEPAMITAVVAPLRADPSLADGDRRARRITDPDGLHATRTSSRWWPTCAATPCTFRARRFRLRRRTRIAARSTPTRTWACTRSGATSC